MWSVSGIYIYVQYLYIVESPLADTSHKWTILPKVVTDWLT